MNPFFVRTNQALTDDWMRRYLDEVTVEAGELEGQPALYAEMPTTGGPEQRRGRTLIAVSDKAEFEGSAHFDWRMLGGKGVFVKPLSEDDRAGRAADYAVFGSLTPEARALAEAWLEQALAEWGTLAAA